MSAKIVTPKIQTSQEKECGHLDKNSGATYAGVPRGDDSSNGSVINFASPKSASLNL